MSKYFIIIESKVYGRYLIDDIEFNTYDDAIKHIKVLYLNPTDISYVVEVVGKAYGEFNHKTEDIILCSKK